MFFPNPDGMDLQDWADSATLAMINYPNSWGMQGDEWQQWGMIFFTDPFLSRYDPPNPYNYVDWQEWARKLADSMAAAPDSPNGGAGGGPGPFSNAAFLVTQDNNNIVAQDGSFITAQ